MQLQHQDVLRVVLIGQLALFDGGAEPAGHVGIAGVGGVAVDVGLDAAFADHHIPVTAGRAGPYGKVLLTLAQDLIHRSVGFPVGGKAAKGDGVAALNILFDCVMQTHNLVHNKTSYQRKR